MREPWRVASVVVALVLVVAGIAATRSITGTGCHVPAVAGTSLESALQAVASVSTAQVSVQRVAAVAPEGTVLAQTSPDCRRPVSLVVSDGGPPLPRYAVPPGLLDLLGDGDGPVRAVRTARGTAYKTDEVLAGDCPAVELARAAVRDPQFVERCRQPLADRFRAATDGRLQRWLGPGAVTTIRAPGVSEHEWVVDATLVDGWMVTVAVTADAQDAWNRSDLPRDESAVRSATLTTWRIGDRAQVVTSLMRPPGPVDRAAADPVTLEQLGDLTEAVLRIAQSY